MMTPDLLVYYLANIIKMAVSECGRCGTTLPPGARSCPACNTALA